MGACFNHTCSCYAELNQKSFLQYNNTGENHRLNFAYKNNYMNYNLNAIGLLFKQRQKWVGLFQSFESEKMRWENTKSCTVKQYFYVICIFRQSLPCFANKPAENSQGTLLVNKWKGKSDSSASKFKPNFNSNHYTLENLK